MSKEETEQSVDGYAPSVVMKNDRTIGEWGAVIFLFCCIDNLGLVSYNLIKKVEAQLS